MTKGERIAKEFRSSGQSQRVWCRVKGINRATLRYWLARIVEGGEKKC